MALGSRGGWPGQSFYLAGMDLNPSSATCMLCGLGPKTYLSMPQFSISKGVWNKNFTDGREVQWVTCSLWSAWCIAWGSRGCEVGEVGVVLCPENPSYLEGLLSFLPHSAQNQFKPLSFLSPSEESSGLDGSICLTPSSTLSQHLIPHHLALQAAAFAKAPYVFSVLTKPNTI